MRSTPIAYLLWFFFGLLGIHRFYLGRPISGVIYLLTGGVFLFGWIIDLFLIPGMVRIANLEWKVATGQRA
ncbi:MAG: NINE protein [Phycisphaerales bacterium]|nr:NINE protein [Phycisphaerales bacterium]